MDEADNGLVALKSQIALDGLIIGRPARQPLRGESACLCGLQQTEADASTGVLLFDQGNPVVLLIAADNDDHLRRMTEAQALLAQSRRIDFWIARLRTLREQFAQWGAGGGGEAQKSPGYNAAVIGHSACDNQHFTQLLWTGTGFAEQPRWDGSAGQEIKLHQDSGRVRRWQQA